MHNASNDPTTALELKYPNQINEWVQTFLRAGKSPNVKLADKLLHYSSYVVGPVEYTLKDLINIVGPDDSYLYYEEDGKLAARVDAMRESIAKGWKQAPLIATDIWNENLEIADGSHRQRALLGAGYSTYSVIFYFRDEMRVQEFLKRQT